MPKATFILGLCGSGKTHLGNKISRGTGSLFIEERVVKGSEGYNTMLETLRNGKDCIVEEICYCKPSCREIVLKDLVNIKDIEVEWICFDNNLEDANWNVDHRPHKSDKRPEHRRINQEYHSLYKYPEGVTPMRIIRVSDF